MPELQAWLMQSLPSTANSIRGVLGLLLKCLQVVQVLWPPARGLVYFQIVKPDQVDAKPIELYFGAPGEAVVESDTGDSRENLDPQRWLPEADYLVVLQENLRLEARRVKTKILQD